MHKFLIRITLLTTILVLPGCAGGSSPTPNADAALAQVDPFELSIRVGRMGVMLDQGNTALGMIARKRGIPLADQPADDMAARRALYADISQVVLDHNRLWVKACVADANLSVCQNMFEPDWLGLPFNHAPTWRQLDMWSGQVQEQVGALAGELCAQAEQDSATRPLCPIE